LLGTQLLLWAAGQPERLSAAARKLLNDPRNELIFSAASLWEITIKSTLGREDFRVEPRPQRRGLLDNDYVELPLPASYRDTRSRSLQRMVRRCGCYVFAFASLKPLSDGSEQTSMP
jgi:hypothetical protein